MSGFYVNDFIVKPIPDENITGKPPKAFKLFPTPYPSIGVIACRRSGKTTVVGQYLNEATAKNGDTKVVVFCNTVKTGVWKSIIKRLEAKGIEVMTFTSIVEDKVNHLDELMETLKEGEEDEEQEEEPKDEKQEFIKRLYGDDTIQEQEKPKKKRPSRYQCPEWIIVLDDISDQLHLTSVNVLIKSARNWKCDLVISTQYLKDGKPELRKNLEYFCLFKGLSDEILTTIHKDADLTLPVEHFIKLYKMATSEKYHFLYIDKLNEIYRRDFNYVYDVEKMFNVQLP